MSGGLAERLAAVRARVADAARAAGRPAGAVTTIVVTKFHPASLVRELLELGVRDLGENRHQEAAAKAAEIGDPRARWHFIGQLQSNKARAVRDYAASVQSLDRPSLVAALAGGPQPGRAPLDVLIQVDLSGEPGRGGVAPAGLEPLAERVLGASGLRLRGLMAVAPLGAEPRRAFAEVRGLGERLRALEPAADWLSMGMSGDFVEAVAEGATHLRIGTAITGKRPPAP
ncbi:MAG: YggS family pyridoxal phosphate-dependent enzyme [Microbacteriaceae bacterium]